MNDLCLCFFFIGWVNLQSQSHGFYFLNPLACWWSKFARHIDLWVLFTPCFPNRNDQHIYETMYTYYNMISRLYFKVLENLSLKQACTRQTSTSVSTHSSPSKFTLEKVSTYKSTSKATKVVCLCYWRTAVRHQLKIQMIQHTTPWSRTGKHKKLGWCQLFLVK